MTVKQQVLSEPMLNTCILSMESFRSGIIFYFDRAITGDSNTDRLYSQWFNSVIYWLINHCMDWERIGVTSIGLQVDLHDVVYHIQPCNVDKRRYNVVFKLI